jgi:voltage-gated potassium channel Kch
MSNFKQKFKYSFDNAMSKGLVSLIGLLAIVTAAFVFVMSALVVLANANPDVEQSFAENLWSSLMHALDPGTVVGDEGASYRFLMLVTTIGGLIFLAGLIGIISGAFDAKVETLRKGRSKVQESEHTLILGWNSRVFALVTELSIANQSRKKASIVVLANRDKVEMEDAIRENSPETFKTKVIVRTGDPMQLSDLEIVNHQGARSVIILADEESSDPDLATIKTALALVNNPNRTAKQYHIVAEIQDPSNLEAARLVSQNEVKWILSGDVMSRLMVQTARTSGLSQIFLELLDFAGDEIYFKPAGDLAYKTYQQAQHSFSNSTLIGIWRNDQVILNENPNSRIKSDDQLILIAPDDSEINSNTAFSVDQSALSNKKPTAAKADSTLILGHNSKLPVIISELAQYVTAGSSATIVANTAKPVFKPSRRLRTRFIQGEPDTRVQLDKLKITTFDHIMVLANHELPPEVADAKTLITLLQIRDIAKSSGKSFNLVSEMLDDKNRKLAESTEADDFIVSDQLIGLMMSQISENKDLAEVFRYLFSSEGSEINLQPASWYVKPGVQIDMHVLIEAAARRSETVLGYRVKAQAKNSEANFGINLNPTKSDKFTLQTDDLVIVLAEG